MNQMLPRDTTGTATETQAELRQRIATALLRTSFSDWDVGEGHTIELPLEVAVDAVMAALAGDAGDVPT